MFFTGAARYSSAKSGLAFCALLVGVSFGLSGCDQNEKARQTIDQKADEAQQSLDSVKDGRQTKAVSFDPLTVHSKVWGGNTAIRMHRGMPLPARFEDDRGITLVSSAKMSLNDIVSAVSSQTGIPVRISSMTLAAKPGEEDSSTGGVMAMGSTRAEAAEETMHVSYEGALSGLLDRACARFGVSWRYDGSTITLSKYETKVFMVEALPGSQQINEGMQDDTSSSSSGGSSSGSSSSSSSTSTMTQNSKTTMDIKYWDELASVLNSMIGRDGNVVTSPGMGTVTVTATPDVMSSIADYLAKENKRLSRQIAINVQIYNVSLQQSEDFSVAFTGFLKKLSKFSGMSYTSAAAPSLANTASTFSSANFGTLNIALLNGPNDPTVHAGDVFRALSSVGDTSVVAQFPMTTLNNRTVSRRVGTDTAYISEVTQQTTSSTSTSTTVTPTTSTIHDGFSLQLTPRLLDDGRILLQYSLSLTAINSLQENTTYGITLPVTDSRIYVQQSMLRSGQTLIIGGVDQEKVAQNKQGVGSPDNFLLGGGTSSNSVRMMMFMAITPQVMDLGGNNEERI